MTSGQEFGSVLATVITPQLLKMGVTYVFCAWAAIAVLWMLAFSVLGASAPERHARCVRSGEADWIAQNREAPSLDVVMQERSTESPFPRRLLKEPCVWAIFAGHVG